MSTNQEIFVAATGTCIPDPTPLEAMIEAGLVPEEKRLLGYRSIAIADDEAPPDMAISAGCTAVERSGLERGDVSLVLHASCWYQGLEAWQAASYVANETVGSQSYAIDLQQGCAGGLAAFQLGTAWLRSGFGSTVLLTTGDRFAPPVMDRCAMFVEAVLGDSGTAVVLSTEGGFARVLATAAVADNSQEGWMRGDAPFTSSPGEERPLRLKERAIAQADKVDPSIGLKKYEEGVLRTRDKALSAANVELRDISRAVIQFVHRGQGQAENYDLLGFTEKQSLWSFGQHVGHLGAGDEFAGLNYLAENKELSPGELVLLLGVGAGFSSGAAVLEIINPPVW